MLKLLFTSKPAITALIFIALLVPLSFIEGLIEERRQFHFQAIREVSDSWTGEQLMIGPVIVIDYLVEVSESRWSEKHGTYVTHEVTLNRSAFLPMETLDVDVTVATEIRSRGIHDVPVYTAKTRVTGTFDPAVLDETLRTAGATETRSIYLWIWATDQRGFVDLPSVLVNDEALTWRAGGHGSLGGTGIRVELDRDALGSLATIEADLTFRGAGALRVVPTGEHTSYAMRSNWQHPKFLGRYLPDKREMTEQGFAANWLSTVLATNINHRLDQCAAGACDPLKVDHFGVQLLRPVDEYSQAIRAIKYGFLFILLVFAGVLAIEVLRQLDIHPLQYALIGAAMAMFYLLLIAVSEHLRFAWAYFIATAMSVVLLTYYGVYVLRSLRGGLLFGLAVTALYGVLFVILQAEDTALLMGTLLTFLVLAALMVLTRDSSRLASLRLADRSALEET